MPPHPAEAPTAAEKRDQSADGQADGSTQADAAQRLREAVPERPTLAPGVSLAGQMQESAFVDPPWLLEKEGEGYVQVTELLYRIAECLDGQHTLEEIARTVSDRMGTGVSADNVRQLIGTQFVLRGLVPAANGKVLPGAGAAARSPLRINKMKMIDPRMLDGITGALRILYWPPIFLTVLAIAAFLEVWLYISHGMGGGVHDALYIPGFMAVVLVVIVISAGFHELGHAAALRYAGGTVRGMGAGMYLIYPAFYTDVSDNYRLKRWARVRTDLGGFYFNLVFILGLMGLYALTGQEFLLVLVFLINLEIIHQLLPFLRLDGYWTLADLTGVPDFFSQMGAFVRSALPVKRWKGRKLPELKTWAKAVFALYILVTIPALAFLMYSMLRAVPRLLATTWDAVTQQAQAFSQAQQSGNVLGLIGSGLQMLLLALPAIAIAYSLYTIGKQLVTGLWHWGEGSAARRAASTIGMVAIAAFLATLWLPEVPGFRRPGLLYYEQQFQPIARQERFTITDAAGGQIVPRGPEAALPVFGSRFAEATPTPEPTASPSPEATSGTPTPATTATATSITTPTLTPQSTTPTPASTIGGTATAAPTAPRAIVSQPTSSAPAPTPTDVPPTAAPAVQATSTPLAMTPTSCPTPRPTGTLVARTPGAPTPTPTRPAC